MRGLVEDCNIISKPVNKGSCVVLWDREDYLAEAEKQLQDFDIYEDTDFKESDLVKLVEKSNNHRKKSLSIFLINIKSQQILVKCISFRKFIKG